MLGRFIYNADRTLNRRNLLFIGAGVTGFLILLSLVLFVLVGTLDDIRSAPQARITQAEVEKQLSEMVAPAGATPTQHNVIVKAHHGTLSNYYRADLTYEQIRAHYDVELARHGWKFQKQIPLTSWDKDLGESQTIYCRGDRAAVIYFIGHAQTQRGFRYALNISWGLSGYCP